MEGVSGAPAPTDILRPKPGFGKLDTVGRSERSRDRQRRGLVNLCHDAYPSPMGTMNISLPDSLKTFVDRQVAGRGYGTSSEYVRELIRRDLDRQHLRELLLEGASSEATTPVDNRYFDDLRARARVQQGK
jgi:antitoxin ParD1/3/4